MTASDNAFIMGQAFDRSGKRKMREEGRVRTFSELKEGDRSAMCHRIDGMHMYMASIFGMKTRVVKYLSYNVRVQNLMAKHNK